MNTPDPEKEEQAETEDKVKLDGDTLANQILSELATEEQPNSTTDEVISSETAEPSGEVEQSEVINETSPEIAADEASEQPCDTVVEVNNSEECTNESIPESELPSQEPGDDLGSAIENNPDPINTEEQTADPEKEEQPIEISAEEQVTVDEQTSEKKEDPEVLNNEEVHTDIQESEPVEEKPVTEQSVEEVGLTEEVQPEECPAEISETQGDSGAAEEAKPAEDQVEECTEETQPDEEKLDTGPVEEVQPNEEVIIPENTEEKPAEENIVEQNTTVVVEEPITEEAITTEEPVSENLVEQEVDKKIEDNPPEESQELQNHEIAEEVQENPIVEEETQETTQAEKVEEPAVNEIIEEPSVQDDIADIPVEPTTEEKSDNCEVIENTSEPPKEEKTEIQQIITKEGKDIFYEQAVTADSEYNEDEIAKTLIQNHFDNLKAEEEEIASEIIDAHLSLEEAHKLAESAVEDTIQNASKIAEEINDNTFDTKSRKEKSIRFDDNIVTHESASIGGEESDYSILPTVQDACDLTATPSTISYSEIQKADEEVAPKPTSSHEVIQEIIPLAKEDKPSNAISFDEPVVPIETHAVVENYKEGANFNESVAVNNQSVENSNPAENAAIQPESQAVESSLAKEQKEAALPETTSSEPFQPIPSLPPVESSTPAIDLEEAMPSKLKVAQWNSSYDVLGELVDSGNLIFYLCTFQ